MLQLLSLLCDPLLQALLLRACLLCLHLLWVFLLLPAV